MAVLLYASKVATIMTLVGAEYFRRGINRELLAVRFTSTNYFASSHMVLSDLVFLHIRQRFLHWIFWLW